MRQHKALRHVGKPHPPAAGHNEGGPDRPLPRKLPSHIRNLINPRAFKEPEDLIQRCDEIWEDQTAEEATAEEAAAAAPRPHIPFRGARCSPSPFRGKGSAGDKSGCRRSPSLGPSRGSRNDRLCFYNSRFGAKAQKCKKGCSYQEN